MEHVIEAKGKSLGRVASASAAILRGKSLPTFAPNRVPSDTKVKIMNASAIRLTGQKLATKTYERYSGYPGGLSSLSITQVTAKHGYKEIVRKAVQRMLPNNKLRPLLMKNLTVEE